jgi:photosystem II stability/assembly factor-like uncharacterized protein
MRKLIGIVGVLGLTLSLPARALTADELVAKNLAARGGAARLAALKSMRVTGKVRFGGNGFSIEAQWAQVQKAPLSLRNEVTIQGLTAVQAYDGHGGWTVSPFQGRVDAEHSSADEAKNFAQDADIAGPLFELQQKGNKVESLGTEDVDGTAAHKLRVTLKDGDVVYLYLDPDTFLAIREVRERHMRGTEEITETDLGSYGQVAGVWMPFSIESGPKGQPRQARFTIETVEPNVEVDDALFRFPSGKSPRSILPGPSPASPNFTAPSGAAARHAPVLDAGVISGLGIRNIGSAAMSGRISSLAAHNEKDGKVTLYIGAASGGVWKSLDSGTTFKPVFDKQSVQSIGAITIDPSNPKTIWVGSGEAWTRNSVSFGDGIYKSTDAGETWTNVGLPKSERIVKILVNPKDSDTVYACVPGRLWSDSPDRGLYKTTDGGKSWDLILTGKNLSTGCSGLTMDPKNPDVLFSGLWDFRRKGWTFRSGGEGPEDESGSGLFRTADGGKSWTPVNGKGIPAQPWGRVAVEIAPSDSNIVYAVIESKDSHLYRSADGGQTWEARDNSQSMVWRAFYFSRLIIDPSNPDRLFKPSYSLTQSEDGGKTFANSSGGAHGDWHDVWIDPQNPKHVIGGDDGGLWFSFDGGNRWWKGANLPISQFYHVAVDDRDPYKVYGGLQDNSSWAGDSAYGGGITNGTWENLYGGDGFWTVPDPTDPDAVYAESQGGNIGRVDRRLQNARDIMPRAGYHEKLRFNWNTPIYASPTDPKTLYMAAQFLFRSRDRGDSWERISPDLTTNDPEKQKQEESGGIVVDNSSAEMYTTIYSVSESPLDAQQLWVGTDDGNLQLSRDAGKSWTNVIKNVKGLPPESWVSWVEASRFDKGTAYAAFDRHTFGDFRPHVYRTSDYGKTWTRLDMKDVRGYAHVIKEDTVKKDLLFLGTELGLFISVDGGKSFAAFKGGDFPAVAVRDLQIQPRDGDLVLATHGRGIWIVDDLSPLRALTAQTLSSAAAFVSGRPVQQRIRPQGGWADGDAVFVGENPPGGAVITYYQRTRHLFGPLKLEVLGPDGKVIDTIPATKRRGLNRVSWNMRIKPPRVPRAASIAFGSSQGPRVVPGTYTVRMTNGDQVIETKLPIELDRRAPWDLPARRANFDALVRLGALFADMSAQVDKIDAARAGAEQRLKAAAGDAALANKLTGLSAHLGEVKKKIVATKEGGAITGEERIREHTDYLYGALIGWEGRPATYQLERIDVLQRELDDVKKELATTLALEVRPLNELLALRGLQPIPTAAEAGENLPLQAIARCLAGDCGRPASAAVETR